ncbi:MAG: hypothetical protein KDK38_06220 [Leptospiraceae bacterium]|nr:hypothetical protein [Leptospiraceae bacterium]
MPDNKLDLLKTDAAQEVSRTQFLYTGCQIALAVSLGMASFSCANESTPDGVQFSGTLTLSAAQKSSLDSNLFLNLEQGVIVIKDGSVYRAFSRLCPHESGQITARSWLSLECERHLGQVFNQNGAGNGFRTSVALKSYTVTDNAGTLTISG